MRKSSAALSVLALSALALTGCSAAPSFDGASCDRVSSENLADAVSVTGDIGAPRAELTTPVRTAELEYADVIVGDGPAVTSSKQSIIVGVAYYDGTSGQELNAGMTLWDSVTAAEQLPGIDAVLPCLTEGSRVVASVPADTLGGAAGDSIIAVIDVVYAALPKAEGHDVFNTANGLPNVVRAPDGRPGVIIPDGAAPSDVVTETLIEGEGEIVGDGQPMFHLTAVGWDDRQVTNTTWDGPASLDVSMFPPAVDTAVRKATIGSQVLVVIPGEGDASAQAYVVDVLGVMPPELSN